MSDKELAALPSSKIYFGARATSYDSGRAGNPVTDEDDEVIKEFIASFKPSAVVVDAPCGTGRALSAVVGAGHAYRGADISSDMLTECRIKAPAGADVDLRVADARSLPWDDKSCDYLLSFKFLKWLPSDDVVFEVLKEYRRVCRGKALVNVKIAKTKPEFSIREIRDRLAKLVDRYTLGSAARSIDRGAFDSMCKMAGWSIDSVRVNSASNGIVYNFVLS